MAARRQTRGKVAPAILRCGRPAARGQSRANGLQCRVPKNGRLLKESTDRQGWRRALRRSVYGAPLPIPSQRHGDLAIDACSARSRDHASRPSATSRSEVVRRMISREFKLRRKGGSDD